MPRPRAYSTAAVVSHKRKRSVKLVCLAGPPDRKTSKCHGASLAEFPYGHGHVPQRHRLSASRGRFAYRRIVPMGEVFHLRSGFDLERLLSVQLVQHLSNKLIGVGE